MAIRAWFWNGLQSSWWDHEKDCRKKGPSLAPLLDFPEDYHLFILTIYQTQDFESILRTCPQLTIHYKQEKPSVSYRYPTDGPKLVTYILKHKDNV